LCVETWLFLVLMVSLLKTIFVNPGYFEGPITLEYQLLLGNNLLKGNYFRKLAEESLTRSIDTDDRSGTNFSDNASTGQREILLSCFSKLIEEGPLVCTEWIRMIESLRSHTTIDDDVTTEDTFLEEKKRFLQTQKLLSETQDKEYLNYEDLSSIRLADVTLCHTCLRWKVERSHHCRSCGKCVLKLDHHCPWLATCIGFRNFKYFCLVHIYGLLATIIIAASFWEPMVYYSFLDSSNIFIIWFYYFVYFANLGLLAFLSWLFYSNFILVFAGQTIIEQADRNRFPSTRPTNFYDLGYYKNFKTVFGENWFFWFLPFYPNYKGCGVIFEKNDLSMPELKA